MVVHNPGCTRESFAETFKTMDVRAQTRPKESERTAREEPHTSLLKKKKKKRSLRDSNAHPELRTAKNYQDTFQNGPLVKWLKSRTQET